MNIYTHCITKGPASFRPLRSKVKNCKRRSMEEVDHKWAGFWLCVCCDQSDLNRITLDCRSWHFTHECWLWPHTNLLNLSSPHELRLTSNLSMLLSPTKFMKYICSLAPDNRLLWILGYEFVLFFLLLAHAYSQGLEHVRECIHLYSRYRLIQ